jgi:flagellar hook-basal body complex protein FliE
MGEVTLRPLVTHNLLRAYAKAETQPAQGSGFANLLQETLAKTETAQARADIAAQAALSGQDTELHRVMIAQEESAITFELMLEVRNKLLEAYQQIMQMQV